MVRRGLSPSLVLETSTSFSVRLHLKHKSSPDRRLTRQRVKWKRTFGNSGILSECLRSRNAKTWPLRSYCTATRPEHREWPWTGLQLVYK